MTDRSVLQSSVGPPRFPIGEEELGLVDLALAEDVGPGDWSTRWIVPARARATGNMVAKADGIIAGIGIVSAVFVRLDPRVQITTGCADGDQVKAEDIVCTVKGPARAILSGQRTALNFLQRLSGIATLTRAYVDAVAGCNVVILDSRKTTPAWRVLERSAVRAGGAQNHHFGLHEMVLIEAAHMDVAGSVTEAINRAHEANHHNLPVIVAVRNKDELKAALEAGCNRIVVDNTDVQFIRETVRVVKKSAPDTQIEASGNMTLERVHAVAETGVDFISVGALTHSATAFELAMQIAL